MWYNTKKGVGKMEKLQAKVSEFIMGVKQKWQGTNGSTKLLILFVVGFALGAMHCWSGL